MIDVKPRIIDGFEISRQTLETIDDLHKIVALEFIKAGIWRLKPDQNGGDQNAC